MDFETCVPEIGRALITVTISAVVWYDGASVPLAEGLDNASAMHTYGLSVFRTPIARLIRSYG
jgi:hypothetical protein